VSGYIVGGLNGGMAEEGLDHPEVIAGSKRWVAKEWRRVCGGDFFLDRPALAVTFFRTCRIRSGGEGFWGFCPGNR